MHIQKAEGFRKAKEITRKFARTFYLASLFLPREKKYASYAVYAICRLSDETVDENISHSDKENKLRRMEEEIKLAYTQGENGGPLLEAFRQTVDNCKIPREYFDELIAGMRMDLKIKRYSYFPSLYDYCYRVAGVVGLIMLKVFGYKDAAAEGYAVKLGVAMQLTNILRDIKEDSLRGRIYLPLEDMERFGVSEEQITACRMNERLSELLRFQIERCRKYYDDSSAGIGLIDNSASRFVVLCMKEMYSGILDEIEKNGYDVFGRRACVGNLRKARIILKIILGRKYL
ncbi:MAG: phytoene/squalene synthase family protein [Candidatus Omnitrophica bacterium]|nr:phytoene/squalene synthase family protein [Candidatus Omnitrophota bacterium]MDD5771385.1 phytoene/squalene synthase family protein [Candidatus Omnitrophota bacterium]